MTIRDRIFWIRFMLAPVSLTIGIVFGLALSRFDSVHRLVESGNVWLRTLLAFSLVLILISAFFVDRLIRCPRCHHRFGKNVSNAVKFEWDRDRINRCPHCRVHLDSPVKPRVPVATP